ncbi:MFS transporter [Lacibacterium aquatile]|uniref:MFS transporter n=1 Tax=Lacibacterium aquatile TaxID=1168082 RepID=A0ABW5DVD6_9PROT
MASIGLRTAAVRPGEQRRVILAASLGTVFEWYDFYLYGSLAIFFGALFFPPGNETAAFLASLATFGAGFAVRPFGALVFGRLGDIVGRKHAFLLTILVMGVSTAAVGLLPTYDQIGLWAPALLMLLRLAQGLALGGEYGGAATYVAEHAPAGRRGLHTSWIQTTATLGFFLSLAVIYVCRQVIGDEDFKVWGWRIPFLASVALLAISTYIRLQLKESPLFTELQAQGRTSRNPLTESFARWKNLKGVLIALLGATAGQGVVWYTGQFYALFFMQNTLKMDYEAAYPLIAFTLLMSTPLFLFFGWLSDKVGRKPIMIAGCLLCAATCIPIFQSLTHAANPALARALAISPVTLIGGGTCTTFYMTAPETPCDMARDYLSRAGIGYRVEPGDALEIRIGSRSLAGFNEEELEHALAEAGYPAVADPKQIDRPAVVALLSLLMLYVAMVYGPIAAFLVELFPTRIRYTSMSLPYHLGNGWFGGFLPFIAFALVVQTGDLYYGLWYPIVVAVFTVAVSLIAIRETKDRDLAR